MIKKKKCNKKTARIKSYYHKQTTFCSLKYYSPEVYGETLRKLSFPSFELYYNIDKSHESFINKAMAVTDNLAPSENKHIKDTSQDWFDTEIMEKINEKDKLSKKFKNSYLYVDKDNITKQGVRYKN